LAEEQVMFGNIDTWLLWQLTSHKVYASDFSNASVTALYDPFQVSKRQGANNNYLAEIVKL